LTRSKPKPYDRLNIFYNKYESIEEKKWVSIDETIDVVGLFISKVIIGALTFDEPGSIFLLNSKEIQNVNHSTIFKLFDQTLNLHWSRHMV